MFFNSSFIYTRQVLNQFLCSFSRKKYRNSKKRSGYQEIKRKFFEIFIFADKTQCKNETSNC